MKPIPLEKPSPAKCVWILDEGSQGHLVQSRGLVRELSKAMPLDVCEVPIRCALPRRISRSLVKRLLRLVKSEWMFRLLHPGMKLPGKKPDLVIASGPHSLAALQFLANGHGCPSVFVQGTLDVPKGNVSVIMRPFEGRHRDDFIFIPLLFTEITPQVVERARDEFLRENPIRPQGPLYALFIGNSSAKIRFTREDWERIAKLVNDLAIRDGARWLITTSYRSGRELEEQFKQAIASDAIFDAVWYSQAPRKVTKAYLGMAERVYVTMDSLTMLTEAISSGREVRALQPANHVFNLSDSHHHYINHLAEMNFLKLIAPGEADPPAAATASPPPVDYSASIQQLLTRLGWNP